MATAEAKTRRDFREIKIMINLSSTSGDENLKFSSDEFSVTALIIKRWRLIVATTLFFAVIGCVYARLAPHVYVAEAVIVENPRAEISNSSNASRAASIFSIDTKITDFDIFKYHTSSYIVASELFNNQDIVKNIYPHDRDDKNNGLHESSLNKGIFSFLIDWILDRSAPQKPSAETMQRYLESTILIKETKSPALTTITYRNKDPKFAEQFLALVLELAHQNTIKLAQTDIKNQVDNLSRKLDSEPRLAIRDSLNSILLDKMRFLSLIEGSVSYPILYIQSVRASSQPIGSRALNNSIIFGFLGLSLSLSYIVGKYLLQAARSTSFRSMAND
jgi:hypothetical protein